MVLGGGDAAQQGRTRRWVLLTLVVSILALVGGLIMVLLLSQFYIVPHLQSDDFVQTQCYVRSIEILHIRKEGRTSKFNNPNCANTTTTKEAPKQNTRNSFDDFDFTLSGTTSQPGLHQTKPSSIFTRNKYDNRRTFPESGTSRRGRARPSNVYRTNKWDPFAAGYSQPLIHKPQAQVQERVLSPEREHRLKEAHPHLPTALAQHATVLDPMEEHVGVNEDREEAQLIEAHPHLPKSLVKHAAVHEPEELELEGDEDEEQEDHDYIPGLPKALAQYAAPPLYTIRGVVKKKHHRRHKRYSNRMSLAPEPGVHALVPAPASHPAASTPSAAAHPRQSQRTSATQDCNSGFVQAGTLCVHVSVLFRGLDGFVALGTLYADQKSLPRENITNEVWPTKKCICDGCTITALSGNGSSVDEILVGKTRIKQGTRTRCYYPMTGGSQLLMFRGSNAIALHAILWPTLVFVSGFVGLFFSCLILQKQRQQRRKQQTRPPMAYV